MRLINRYIILLLLLMCSISSFSQSKEPILTIYIPYADTISQELIDSIFRQEGKYILSYHPNMAHLIPEMRCRRTFVPGRRIGVFSVAKDRQVSFSQGNLQYVRTRAEWKFAENQWDYLCGKNTEGKYIDLFDWVMDASGCFVDWGQYEIQGDEVNSWRTLTIDEWKWLLHDRPRATELLGAATVNGVVGIVILPDEWQLPEGVDFISVSQENYIWVAGSKLYQFYEDVYLHNIFTSMSWQQMEQAGAVFLPASGYLDKSGALQKCNSVARYWSSTPHDKTKGYYISFGFHEEASTRTIRTYSCVNSDKGHTVRLVHDTIVPPPVPCQTFSINGVSFNMMCVEGGTFMMGATEEQLPYAKANEKPVHQVTVSDFMMSQTEVTQELWKAVMGTTIQEHHAANPSTSSIAGVGDTHPMYMINKADCQVFIQKLNELTGLHFRMPTEAEWEYAARGGRKSRGFIYSGSDNMDEVAWHLGNSGNKTHPVAQKQPNELGLYDMSGNVWEWVSDWASNYTVDAQVNPIGPATGNYYVIRGGSRGWSEHNMTRVSARKTDKKIGENDRSFIGLRLVLDENKVEVRLSYDEGREKLGKNKE